jgi:hypothetical protein
MITRSFHEDSSRRTLVLTETFTAGLKKNALTSRLIRALPLIQPKPAVRPAPPEPRAPF